MVALDSYEILIKTQEKELNIDVDHLGFRMKSSIWEILPKGFFVLKDSAGLFQEFLLTIPGTPLSITYGYKGTNQNVTQEYIVDYDSIDDLESKALINGDVEMTLVHKWLSQQKSSTQGFNDLSSNVINTLLNRDFSNNKKDIEATQNDNTWYQMGKLQKDFIEDILLPTAYSTNARQTPFFCYIDNNGVFTFKSYYQMVTSKPVAELTYKVTTESEYNKNILLDIARTRRKYSNNLNDNKINVSAIDVDTGDIIEDEDTVLLYPNNISNEYLPRASNENLTKYEFYDRAYDINDITGERIFRLRDSISQDRFILIANYDPVFNVGKLVKLKCFTIQTGEESPNTLSQFAGDYLIEECEHIWGGIDQSGALSKMVVSRKYAKYSNNYILKGDLTK